MASLASFSAALTSERRGPNLFSFVLIKKKSRGGEGGYDCES